MWSMIFKAQIIILNKKEDNIQMTSHLTTLNISHSPQVLRGSSNHLNITAIIVLSRDSFTTMTIKNNQVWALRGSTSEHWWRINFDSALRLSSALHMMIKWPLWMLSLNSSLKSFNWFKSSSCAIISSWTSLLIMKGPILTTTWILIKVAKSFRFTIVKVH